MSAEPAVPTRRCPSDGRPLESALRWLCPRCLREYADSPALIGAPRAPTGHDAVGGKPINLKLGEARQRAVDDYAWLTGVSRAKAVRVLLDAALSRQD